MQPQPPLPSFDPASSLACASKAMRADFGLHLALASRLVLLRLVPELEFDGRDAGGGVAQRRRARPAVRRSISDLVQAAGAGGRAPGPRPAGASPPRSIIDLRLLLPHHRRGRRHRLGHLDDQVAQHRVVELERVLELGQGLVVALDVHEHVVRLVHLGDRVGELAAAPVLEAVHRAVAGRDDALVALDHRGHLLALVGMDDENDLVMPHADWLLSLWVRAPRHA